MKKENGITLIALVITIIIMLILVGVTINFALNGGIINKAKEATIQTEIAMIKEQLMIKKAEIIANNMGDVPAEGYGLSSISDLDGLSESTITKYNSKLTISPDGTLYYLEDKVTGEEKVYFENAEITAYQEQTPEPVTSQNQWQQWGLTAENIQYDTEYTIASGPAMAQLGSNAYLLFGSECTLVNTWDDPLEYEDLNSLKQKKALSIPNNNSILVLNVNNEEGIYDSSNLFKFNNNSVSLYAAFDNINYTSEQVANLSDSEITSIAQLTLDDNNLMGIFVASGT